jgi:hypothetical protein
MINELERVTAQTDLQHLTNLTRLFIGTVQDTQLLPAQLQELRATEMRLNDSLSHLQQLTSMSLAVEFRSTDLAPLTALASLTPFKLETSRVEGGMSELFRQLPKLPLVSLWSSQDRFSAQDVECLGRCRQLTKLEIDAARVRATADDFAQQLQRLHRRRAPAWRALHASPRHT